MKLYSDWQNTKGYFIIGRWIDSIEKKERKRKKLENYIFSYFPSEIWIHIFSYINTYQIYYLLTVSTGIKCYIYIYSYIYINYF